MKKLTDSKNQEEPIPQTEKSITPAKGKFTYKNLSTVTINNKSKISAFISKEDPRVSKRLKDRKIKVSDRTL